MLRLPGSFAAVVVLLTGTAAVVHVAPKPKLSGSDLAACPMEIADLKGREAPIKQFVIEELNPTEMIQRTYVGEDRNETVWLVLAYFENARYGAHDPKVCYRAAGWQTNDLEPALLRTRSGRPVEAPMFSVKRRGEERLVLYIWYISDTEATGDHRRFLNTMALQGILRGSNFGSFVRVSTSALPDRETAALRLHRFGAEVLKTLPDLLRSSERRVPS